MTEVVVAALGVLAALITGVFTVKAVKAERSERPAPTKPTPHVRGGRPVPRSSAASAPPSRRTTPAASTPRGTTSAAPAERVVTPPPGQQVLPLVRRRSKYAGMSEQELQVALLTDANFLLQQGDTFEYRKTRKEVDPA